MLEAKIDNEITAITRELFVFMRKNVPVRSIRFYDTSGGFSGTTEGGSAIPSSEIDCDLYYPKKLGLRPLKDWQSAAGRLESHV